MTDADTALCVACAQAMGLTHNFYPEGVLFVYKRDKRVLYNPLSDDAQCMALVRLLRLTVVSAFASNDHVPADSAHQFRVIGARRDAAGGLLEQTASGNDLNRAIVECVAKLHALGDILKAEKP